jgi:hypothetical protein
MFCHWNEPDIFFDSVNNCKKEIRMVKKKPEESKTPKKKQRARKGRPKKIKLKLTINH